MNNSELLEDELDFDVEQFNRQVITESFNRAVLEEILLTTGIDVPEITTLVFLRRVKSRILFEQMLGRATRLCPEIKKTHFEIYDPVSVYDAFAEFIRRNRNEIAALSIICTHPRELTRESLRKLRLTLDREGFTTQRLNTGLSELTNEEMAADIISIIRRYAIGSALISHETRIRRAVERLKKAHKCSKQEANWIMRMEKYLMEESVLNIQVFDEDSRFKAQGGLKRIDKVFQNQLEGIVLELNEYLYDDGGRTG